VTKGRPWRNIKGVATMVNITSPIGIFLNHSVPICSSLFWPGAVSQKEGVISQAVYRPIDRRRYFTNGEGSFRVEKGCLDWCQFFLISLRTPENAARYFEKTQELIGLCAQHGKLPSSFGDYTETFLTDRLPNILKNIRLFEKVHQFRHDSSRLFYLPLAPLSSDHHIILL
jgi:hypothetical protein